MTQNHQSFNIINLVQKINELYYRIEKQQNILKLLRYCQNNIFGKNLIKFPKERKSHYDTISIYDLVLYRTDFI